MYRTSLMLLVAQAAISSTALAPAYAFDDKEFCAAAQQFARAAATDIDQWLDRTTRNGGMAVSCDAKLVEFRRFVHASLSVMNESWKQRQAHVLSSTHCNNPIWKDAIGNGWRIALSITTTDGSRMLIPAQCDHSTSPAPS